MFSKLWLLGAYQRLLVEGILFTGLPAFIVIKRVIGASRLGLLALMLCALGAFFRGSALSVPIGLVMVFVAWWMERHRVHKMKQVQMDLAMKQEIAKSKRRF